jgi:hypothetical protein
MVLDGMARSRELLRRVQQFWLALFITISITLLLVYLDDVRGQLRQPTEFRPLYLMLALLLQVLLWLTLTRAWQRVVGCWTRIALSLRAAFFQSSLFGLGKYLPGKVWGILARGTHLGRYGLKTLDIATATLHEQILVLHTALVLCAVFGAALLVGPCSWPVVIAALASIFVGAPLSTLGFRLLSRLFFTLDKSTSVPRNRPIGIASYCVLFGWFTVAWLLSGFVLVALHLAFVQEEFTAGTVNLLILANTASVLAGFSAIFAPAGIGVKEVALVSILALGMDLADAILLSVLARLWSVSMDLASAGVAIIIGAERVRAK